MQCVKNIWLSQIGKVGRDAYSGQISKPTNNLFSYFFADINSAVDLGNKNS